MYDFSKIDEWKQKLDAKRPIPDAALRNLREVYRVDWTYHSNAIEGNTLSAMETKLVLEEGLTIGGKTLREHFEAINHAQAIAYVEEVVRNQIELSEKVIKDIHALILKNIDDENAGRYRPINVRLSGSEHWPPFHLLVQDEMGQLIREYRKKKNTVHPVERAAWFHFRFVSIHPFVAGNGRTARLLMNVILMNNGYPPAIIKSTPDKRLAYYEALEKASLSGETRDFTALVAESAEESLKRYLEVLE